MEDYNLNEIYSNSPLMEVVCEIRFNGDLSIECHRDQFQKKVINDYPSLLVPHFQPDKPHSLQPYVFSKKNNKRGIQLALNSLSYYEKDYGRHKDFISEFSEIITKFKETFEVSSINRLGWRYINLIPFTREDHLISLSRFLNLGINSPYR